MSNCCIKHYNLFETKSFAVKIYSYVLLVPILYWQIEINQPRNFWVIIFYCICLPVPEVGHSCPYSTVATTLLALRWMSDSRRTNGMCTKNNTRYKWRRQATMPHICGMNKQWKSDHGLWTLLLLAATVWSFAHMTLRIFDRNSTIHHDINIPTVLKSSQKLNSVLPYKIWKKAHSFQPNLISFM